MVRQYSQKLEFRHLIIKDIGDLLIVQVFVRGEEQLHDFHRSLVGQAELAIGVSPASLPRFTVARHSE